VPFGFSTMLIAGSTGLAALLLARPMISQTMGTRLRRFNLAMGGLLAGTALWLAVR
jgi:hypothetical protein